MPTIQDDIAGLISTEQRSDFSRAVAYKQRVRLAERGIREYLSAVDEWEKEEPNLEPDDRKILEKVRREDLETAESNLRQILSALA